jgi:hypothetical protein
MFLDIILKNKLYQKYFLKIKKYIILIYFGIKSSLKDNRCHISKHYSPDSRAFL